jgi:hypothetical protein
MEDKERSYVTETKTTTTHQERDSDNPQSLFRLEKDAKTGTFSRVAVEPITDDIRGYMFPGYWNLMRKAAMPKRDIDSELKLYLDTIRDCKKCQASNKYETALVRFQGVQFDHPHGRVLEPPASRKLEESDLWPSDTKPFKRLRRVRRSLLKPATK